MIDKSRQNSLPYSGLKIDALLVSHLPNVRYLSNFTGSNGMVLLTPDSTTLFTDPRYTIQASEESRAKVVIAKGPLIKRAAQAIKQKGLKRIGFEKAWLPYEDWETLKHLLPLGAGLTPIAPVIEKQRMVKNTAEIDLIRRAVNTNSAAFDGVLKHIRPGQRESDLAAEIEYQMRRRGAEKPSFETIVASGTRTALPHAQPGPSRFNDHEVILIDMGATQAGYSSDMTRMVFLGRPDPKIRKIYEAVLKTQLAAIDAVREGVAAKKVDAAARNVLKAEKLDKEFVHSTGHGLGLEIHEPPKLGKKEATRLAAGMVVTIEPGVYVRGLGGVRIEDTVLVTKNGCEVLTPTSKELMVL